MPGMGEVMHDTAEEKKVFILPKLAILLRALSLSLYI
jgi:hypothetical protein